MDIEQFSLIVMQQVKAYVQPAIDALAQRIDDRESTIIAALDKKLAELTVTTSLDPDQVRAIVAESVQIATPDLEPFCAEIRAMVAAIPVPQDGKSVTAEELRPMLTDEVAKAVAALPVPEPIEMSIDSSEIVAAMKEGIEEATKELPSTEEIKLHVDASVAASVASAIAALPVPRDGESVTLDQVQPLVDAAVQALPPAERGKDADPVDMAVVADLIKAQVDALPKPADGNSITIDDVRPMVTEFLAAIPAPKDGASVTIEEMTHQLEAVVESKQASWELHFERRAQDRLQSVIDRIPAPKNGKDGTDALDIDNFEVDTKDFGRTLVFRLKRGDTVIEREVVTGVVLDRGVYLPDAAYLLGDAVSWGGSTWIAQSATKARPETDGTWRLAVKRGREGKPGSNVPAAFPTTVKLP